MKGRTITIKCVAEASLSEVRRCQKLDEGFDREEPGAIGNVE